MERNRNETLESFYFRWLCEFVNVSPPYGSYTRLLYLMHIKPFKWSVRNDDNRYFDGIDLRNRFIWEHLYSGDLEGELKGHCTILEMIAALALRIDILMEDEGLENDQVSKWFWVMMDNLGLTSYNDDDLDDILVHEVNEILDRLVDRAYDEDGNGGLFPLTKPKENQKKVELWYQMNAYLLENYF